MYQKTCFERITERLHRGIFIFCIKNVFVAVGDISRNFGAFPISA